MNRKPRAFTNVFSLALFPLLVTEAGASTSDRQRDLDRIMGLAKNAAYQSDLYVDVSRLAEGLMAIAFHSDGLLELNEPAVATLHFYRRGGTIRYRTYHGRNFRQRATSSPDPFQMGIQQRLSNRMATVLTGFLEALHSDAEQHGIRLRRSGSRILAFLLAEDQVDLKPDEKLFRYTQESLERFRDLSGAIQLRVLGLEFRKRGEYLQAKGLLERAREAHRSMLGEDHPHTVMILNELALVHMELGDRDRANQLFDLAMRLLRDSIGFWNSHGATVLFNLSILHSHTEDRDELEMVRAMAERALEIHTATAKVDNMRAAIHNGLGLILRNLEDLDSAQMHFERALEIYRTIPGGMWGQRDDRETLSPTSNLAEVLLAKGDLDGAKRYFDEALQASERWLPPSHPRRIQLLFTKAFVDELLGDVEEATENLRMAFSAEEAFLASTLPSGSSRQKMLLMDQQAGYLHSIISFHVRAAPQSTAAARLALEGILQRKARLLDGETRQRFADRPFDTEELETIKLELRALEAEKARLFWRHAENSGSEQSRSAMRHLEEKIDVAAAKLANLAASLDHFQTLQDLDRDRDEGGSKEWSEMSDEERARASSRYAAITGTTWSSPSLEEIQAAVPENAALVELFVFVPSTPMIREGVGFTVIPEAPRYIAYVLHRTGAPGFVELGAAEAIDDAAEKLRAAIAHRRGDVRDRARDLDALTMAKIRPLLDQVRKVIVSPDGTLNLVPFAALVDAEGRYLIESHDLSVVGGGREILGFGAEPSDHEAPLVLGGVDFGETAGDSSAISGSGIRLPELAPLPGTMTEANSVGELLGLPRGRVLIGAAATAAAVKGSRGPRILHIATHGLFLQNPRQEESTDWFRIEHDQAVPLPESSDDPLLRSALALAGFNRRGDARDADDGVLTALEVASLDLRGTEVVVLSACDTGVGQVHHGEGVFGLRRAFAIAGARTQVVSLWQVADEATKDLMLSWYRQVLDGVPRAEAMRRVQLAALRGQPLPGTEKILSRGGKRIELSPANGDSAVAGTRHPYYWASFIVSGEPGPLRTAD